MDVDAKAAIADLMALLPIRGESANEDAVADRIEAALLGCGVSRCAITRDRAFEASEYGGSCGNLIVRFPAVGEAGGSARLLTAHMDTVALAVGCRPRLIEATDEARPRIVNDNPQTALGADDRAGCAALLQLARAVSARPDRPRPAIGLVFLVQEEVGLVGSREFDPGLLGFDGPILGFNFDGASVHNVVTKVTGTSRVEITVHGKAAHAGEHPGEGISAAVAASRAIARLADEGWHGPIEKPEGTGSANVGTLRGGAGTNVVMDRLQVLAEARSHDRAFRERILETCQRAFQQAAAETTNLHGQPATVTFRPLARYESLALADDASVVLAAVEAAGKAGVQLSLVSNDGGMDANNLTAKGIETVSLGLGPHEVHTPSEWLDVAEFLLACRVALRLVGG